MEEEEEKKNLPSEFPCQRDYYVPRVRYVFSHNRAAKIIKDRHQIRLRGCALICLSWIGYRGKKRKEAGKSEAISRGMVSKRSQLIHVYFEAP